MFAALFKKNAKPWELFENGTKSWQEFTPREQQAITCAYLPKVRYLAQKQKSRVPAHIDLSDLVSAGTMGLVEALSKYRPETGFAFTTYAESRIKGAMLDEMRRRDPLSRATRANVKKLQECIDNFESRKGRKPSEAELVKLSKLSLSDVRQGLQAMEQQITTDMDLLVETLSNEAMESGGIPFKQTSSNEMAANIRFLLTHLSERDNFILSMSFIEEYSLREIAEALHVSEGRVSQLRTQALKRLRDLYVKYYGR